MKKDRSTTSPLKNSRCHPQFVFLTVQKYTGKREIKLQRKKTRKTDTDWGQTLNFLACGGQ